MLIWAEAGPRCWWLEDPPVAPRPLEWTMEP